MTISGSARLAGVMGWPIAHSRSPRIHGYWLQDYGIDGAYVPLAIEPGNLAECFAMLPKVGFRGWNITLPHKEAALKLVHAITPAAERIGAVNTVTVQPDGTLSGDNSDAFGFTAHLDQTAPGWPSDRPAVVLGAGGAARAICFALLDAGVPEVRIANRTLPRAQALAEANGPATRAIPWEARSEALQDAGLLVKHHVLRDEWPTATLHRSVGIASRRGCQRHRLCAARDALAGRCGCPWLANRGWPRHVVASGPPWLFPLVRPRAGRNRCPLCRYRKGSCAVTRPVFVIGLTGSIGMGKSTASSMLKSMGLPIFDADATVHGLMAKGGAAVAAVEAAFPGVAVDGAVSRPELGKRVFGNDPALRQLERILHPPCRPGGTRLPGRCCQTATTLCGA